MSADRNTSNGAPFEIWAAKVPDDPRDNRTLLPVCASKVPMISFTAKPRSDAAAARTSAAWAGTVARNIRKIARQIFFICLVPYTVIYDIDDGGVGAFPSS